MSLRVRRPGPEATLQAAPRTGLRHQGVPFAGPADPVSMALANRIVGNRNEAVAVEITLGGFEAEAETDVTLALAGAPVTAEVSGRNVDLYEPVRLSSGERLTLLPPKRGMRTYLALAGGIRADPVMGSSSTYLPAAMGGLGGRTLQTGDLIEPAGKPAPPRILPEDIRPAFPASWALRAVSGPEAHHDPAESPAGVFAQVFTVASQSNRMGIRLLADPPLQVNTEGRMPSVPVFPGTVQVPEDGQPILLGVDAQTTGGYPRLAQVAACDRHLIGQLRPGDRVRFLRRSAPLAETEGKAKRALLDRLLSES